MERIINIILENPVALIFLGMIIIGFLLLVISIFQKKSTTKEVEQSKEPISITKELKTLKDIDNMDEEKENIFKVYKEVEIARMKFCFPILEEKIDKNLYQKYEIELKDLKKKHQKIVSTDITLEKIEILSRKKKENVEQLEIFLHVSQYDYVIDKEKKVIRGTDEDRYQIEYKMTVEKNLETQKYILTKKECVGKWIKK